MHIAFVTFGNFDGHATLKRATGMAGALMAEGIQVSILLEESIANRERVALECPSVSIIWHQRTTWAPAERLIKTRSLEGLKPDVVWICGLGLRNWVKRPHRQCIMLADHSELFSALNNGPIYRFRYWLTEWLSCICFDGHICASRFLEAFYRQRLSKLKQKKPVHYSPYAYELPSSDFSNLPDLWDKRNHKFIFYLGSLQESYDMWTMLCALKKLVTERNDCIAILGGRGPDEQRARAWLESEGLTERIRMVGYLPEAVIPPALRQADVFICPLQDSKQDWARCPSKLYMYYPYAKPIVTCAIGEAKELLGGGGYYYLPGDADSMAARMSEALDDKGDQLVTDPEKYSWDARARSFLNWFEQSYPNAV